MNILVLPSVQMIEEAGTARLRLRLAEGRVSPCFTSKSLADSAGRFGTKGLS
jgi:hypothetical protein